ncbi:MAG: 16S rRNA (uracil(1498)-N(3))-methyltransferase [Eggerthellaceae bacterium]|nr:16S rRNA (uracil(1498)-N(3))-methyltransferase [Eggerthellaceae bacterium]
MSFHHYFLKDQVLAKEAEKTFSLFLSEEDFKHARVQRLKAGEHISLIDAEGVHYECVVEDFCNKFLKVSIVKKLILEPPAISLSLALAILMYEKNDQVIKACTEIGITKFLVFNSSRSVSLIKGKKADKRLDRYLKIAKSAAMQSGSYFIPIVEIFLDMSELCGHLVDFDKVLVLWEEAELKNTLKSKLSDAKSGKFLLVVGPEGGFSHADVLEISKSHPTVEVISLGTKILRAETAAIAASAIALSCMQ